MKPYVSWIVIGLSAFLHGCRPRVTVLRLQPERQVVLHVGELAAIDMASDARYSLGGAGSALILEDRNERNGVTTYLYRAMSAGQQTIVATPAEPGPSNCISCVTIHYFVKVE